MSAMIFVLLMLGLIIFGIFIPRTLLVLLAGVIVCGFCNIGGIKVVGLCGTEFWAIQWWQFIILAVIALVFDVWVGFFDKVT